MKLIPFWMYVVGALIVNILSETLSKKWGINQRPLFAILILILSSTSTICWMGLMAHKNQLALLGLLWVVVSAILSTTIGVGFFGESFSTRQWFGVAIAGIAIYLLCE